MKGNEYFQKEFVDKPQVLPRGFDNASQYAASFGGPIWKNKAFFFWNYEGLRVIIPVTNNGLLAPTQAFETAIIDNLTNTVVPLPGSGTFAASVPFYNQMFAVYNGAKGYSTATPGSPGAADPTGCQGNVFTDPVTNVSYGAGTPNNCTQSFSNTAGNFTHEYLTSGRFDFNVTNNDKLWVRLQEDIGTQATATDALNPVFNSTSYQPEYQAQISWNRTLGVKAVNNLLFSAQYYRAIFAPSNLNKTLSFFPTTLLLNDGSLSTIGGLDYIWPQGRNVTGYQLVDDFSYNLSSQHTLKLGLYFHRNLISDHDYGLFTSGLALPLSLDDFYAGGQGSGATGGGTTVLLQNFTSSPDQPIKLYHLGRYLQDEWHAKHDLKHTL